MTLTFPVLNQASKVAVLVLGDGKADVMQKLANENKVNRGCDHLPVCLLDNKNITWFADNQSMSRINIIRNSTYREKTEL